MTLLEANRLYDNQYFFNKTKEADRMGITRRTLDKRIKKAGKLLRDQKAREDKEAMDYANMTADKLSEAFPYGDIWVGMYLPSMEGEDLFNILIDMGINLFRTYNEKDALFVKVEDAKTLYNSKWYQSMIQKNEDEGEDNE